MSKRELTKTGKLLIYLAALGDILSPLADPYELRRRVLFGSPGSFNSTVYKMRKRGWLKIIDKNAEKFYKLTKKGQIEALMAKALLPVKGKWDGKWRLIVFDIPEDYKEKRTLLRKLLKRNSFYQLQASVYINPFPLNRAAIEYLQTSGLISYIRMLKVEEMDNDKELRKYFNLKK